MVYCLEIEISLSRLYSGCDVVDRTKYLCYRDERHSLLIHKTNFSRSMVFSFQNLNNREEEIKESVLNSARKLIPNAIHPSFQEFRVFHFPYRPLFIIFPNVDTKKVSHDRNLPWRESWRAGYLALSSFVQAREGSKLRFPKFHYRRGRMDQ